MLFAALLALCGMGLAPLTRLAAHEGEHFSAGQPGDPRKPFRVVEVSMSEGSGTMSSSPSTLDVKKGEQIKFIVTNNGALTHEFILADTKANLRHAALMLKYPD